MNRYTIKKNAGTPAYMQLYRQIRRDITSGILRYGERLPSKRMLSDDTGTSVITAEHAYQLLQEEGYIEARERSGYYVSYKEEDNFPVADRAFDPIPQVSPIPPVNVEPERIDFPFAAFARTMRKVLSLYGERILIKSPNFGVPELRSALARYLARSRGMVVSPDQIVIGSGSEYLYTLIVQMLGRDRLYGIEDPSYSQIRRVYEACGAKVDPLQMGSNGILTSALNSTRARVLHITPFHSYPSGVTADVSKRHEYIRWAKRRGGIIIEDDMDSEFTMSTKAEDTMFSLEPTGTVIYMNTFTRTIAPSMRSGYMVLPSDLADQFSRKIDFYSCTVPVFEQYVLAEFIGSGSFERHINRVRRQLRNKTAP